MLGPLSAGQVCHGAGGAPSGPVLLPPDWLPAVDRARTRRVVFEVAGFLWGSGSAPCAGVRCQGVVWGGGPTNPVFKGLGMAPLPAGDAQCPWIPVAVWCCGGCPCAARLDARSCRGLCGVPALDGARASLVRVASVVRCWCGVATGVGGAESDGLDDMEDVAADARARTFVAPVAVVARIRCGGVVMVAVLREEEDEPSSPVPLAIMLATAALPYVPSCGGGRCRCWARCASGRSLRGGGDAPPCDVGRHQPLSRPRGHGPTAVKEFPPLAAMGAAGDAHRPFHIPHQPAEGDREARGEGDDDGAVVVVVHGAEWAPTVWQVANGG